MAQLSDYIFYGVELKVASVVDLASNKVMVQFKPVNCGKVHSELKNTTLVYIGQNTNSGLFKFMFETDRWIQTYALSLKEHKLSANVYLTKRLFMNKPGRK